MGPGRSFPDDFLFGCATSAYQVEGGITNDWSAWAEAGRLKDPSARNERAVEHWDRYLHDFDLLAGLGANAYRMSVEWARIEPEPGRYDDAALAHYGRMFDALLERGIEPMVTFFHFTHPPWFHATCPWHLPERGGPERFAAFVERSLEVVAPRVRRYTILNEPGVWLTGAYLAGAIPPGEKGLGRVAKAGASLLLGHALAAAKIRKVRPDAELGIAHNVVAFAPESSSILDRLAAGYVARQFNHAVPRAFDSGVFQLGETPGLRYTEKVPGLVGTLDFLGINYYSRVYVGTRLRRPYGELSYQDREGRGVTDLGWEIHPSGLTRILAEMARYRRPIYVTENGLDDRDDSRRAAFLHDHLAAVLDAREQGVDVRGYFHWSLLDNFEWLEGHLPRFGLFRVDPTTMERSPTQGAEHYRRIIQARALPTERPPATLKPGLGPVRVG
ncbi:MAG: glycoside hydrolase family 1 protein [Deltaproteobacteria bacterium]|nr:glycoside hydrolase family 1 protein [Deltaproteobacteria bacterium]